MLRPFGRFIGQGCELGRVGQFLDRDPRRREKRRGLAVAQGDRPGLVEEQHIDVAGGLDGAPAHGQDVLLDHAVDAGDPDRVQKPADRRRDQADEEGDEHGRRQGDARIRAEGAQGHDDDQEDDRQRREQDGQGDLVRRLLASGALDKADHPVEEARPGIGRHADLDPVGQDARPAGDRAPVAARLADDRGGLAGDGGLVHHGRALDDLPVGRNDLADRDDDQVTLAKALGGDRFDRAVGPEEAGREASSCLAELVGLGLAPALGHRFGEIGEQDREPQPEGDLEREARRLALRSHRQADCREQRPDLGDEDDRVLEQVERIELLDRGEGRPADEGPFEKGMVQSAHVVLSFNTGSPNRS